MDLIQYQDFVHNKLSNDSKSFLAFVERLRELNDIGFEMDPPINIPALLTAADGLAAEGGEFAEVVKKITFQGKPLNEDNRFHLKRELGDLAFYMAVACIALGYNLQEIIDENVVKLDARYKDGFTVEESEKRASGDL
jgi:NTP pyrophosphatase (non-canonical NTP hydrolase)